MRRFIIRLLHKILFLVDSKSAEKDGHAEHIIKIRKPLLLKKSKGDKTFSDLRRAG